MDMILRRIETGPSLQVLLVDVSAEEFAADLSGASDLSETGLYSMLVDKPSQDKNGGVSLILGLYQFEPTPPHAELLGRMAKIAKLANAPFITSINARRLHRPAQPAASADGAGAGGAARAARGVAPGAAGAALHAAPSLRQEERSDQRLRVRGVHARGRPARHALGPSGAARRDACWRRRAAARSRSATCRSTTSSTATATRSRCRRPSGWSTSPRPRCCAGSASTR